MRLATHFAKTTDPLARLRDGLRLYIEFGLAHPHHYTVSFMVKPRELRTSEPTAGHRAFAFLQAAVAGAMASGAIRPGEVETTSQALWAACHGIVALLITVPEDRFAFVPADRLVAAHARHAHRRPAGVRRLVGGASLAGAGLGGPLEGDGSPAHRVAPGPAQGVPRRPRPATAGRSRRPRPPRLAPRPPRLARGRRAASSSRQPR